MHSSVDGAMHIHPQTTTPACSLNNNSREIQHHAEKYKIAERNSTPRREIQDHAENFNITQRNTISCNLRGAPSVTSSASHRHHRQHHHPYHHHHYYDYHYVIIDIEIVVCAYYSHAHTHTHIHIHTHAGDKGVVYGNQRDYSYKVLQKR